jgi:predicted deacetylase
VDPYAKPKERKIGAHRPKIRHVQHATELRTRRERQAEKEQVAAQRRAIKKAARRHLKQQILAELENAD